MNWLDHPIATAAYEAAYRLFHGRLGCMSADDARQEGAIKAWRLGGRRVSYRTTGERVAVDLMRREGAYSRDGTLRVDRANPAPLDDALGVPCPHPTPEQRLAMHERARMLESLPPHLQIVVDGVLAGDTMKVIGQRLSPPVSISKVSALLDEAVRHAQ